MKKFILPLLAIFTALFFLSFNVAAQEKQDCRKIFDKDMKKCSIDFNACQAACSEETKKPDGTEYINSGEIFPKCMKASDCHGKNSACNEQSLTNLRACGKSDKQPAAVEAKEEKSPLEKLLSTPVFVGEWFERISAAWAGLSFLDVSSALGSQVLADPEIAIWEEEQRQKDDKAFKEYMQEHGYVDQERISAFINRPPTIKEISDFKSGAWGKDDLYRLDILTGDVSIKYPGENEWKDLKEGEKIPPGSRIFTGMDTTTMINIKNKGVIQVLPFTEITVNEYGLDRAATAGQTTTDIKIDTGEIEVYTEKQFYEDLVRWRPSLRVQFFNNYAAPRGTHFWVSYDKVKNLSAIGVYKGEVEIKSQGETHLVSPTSDGPGIIVIAQKLSPVKIAIFGLVLAAVLGSVLMILRRKFSPKGFSKKNK